MNKSFLLCSFIVLTIINNIAAQSSVTLQQVIEHALEYSYTINTAKLSLESSRKTLEATERGLMTAVDFELDAPRYSRSLRSQFNSSSGTDMFYQTQSTVMEARLALTQPIIWTNGTFSINGSLFGRDQFSNSSSTARDYFSNLSFRLRQPLFGFNSQGASMDKAELNMLRSLRNFNKAEADLVYQVTDAFYGVYRAKREFEITREKVKQTEISYETAANKFKAGLIAEVEALQLEVDLASSRNDLLAAETSYKESRNTLKITAGYPLDEDIDVSGAFSFIPVEINPDSAINYALINRPEIKNTEADIILSTFSRDETNYRGRVTGLLTANYGINKNDKVFADVFKQFLEDRSVTLTLQVPVWDWGKNARETEAAEANVKISKLNSENQRLVIRKEIESVYNRFQAAKARVEVLSKSVELAQKSFDISMSRFQAGSITSFDLTQMQIRLTDSKLNSLNALIDYLLSVADMERKTLHRFNSR